MIVLAAMMILGGSEPVNYWMIKPDIVNNDDIDGASEWLGLFDMACSYRLQPVEVQFTPEDREVCEGYKLRGLTVELPGGSYSSPLILLSSSIPVFSTGNVLTVVPDYMHLFPNLSVVFCEDELEEVRLFTNREGLYLSNEQITQHITETFPGEENSETFMGILWAGDLDRDGKLDLLLNDVADEYGRFTWDLYLSTEASSDQLVRKVATFH
jgi:hypothetical protein